MVQCSACPKKPGNIIEETAVKCVGCENLYHKSCAKRLLKEYGSLPSGAFIKCCGSSDDMFQFKASNKHKSTLDNKSQMETISTMSSQQLNPNSVVRDDVSDEEVGNRNSQATENCKIGSAVLHDEMTNLWNKIEDKMDKLMKNNMDNFINENRKSMDEIYSVLDKKFNDFMNKIDSQQSQIDIAVARIENVEKSMETSSLQCIEETIFEINERKKRELNLIFYNVPDVGDRKLDKQIIVALFPVDMRSDAVTHTFRIGNRKSSKSGATGGIPSQNSNSNVLPLKVVFSSRDLIHWLFENRSKLNLNGMSFSSDRTIRQRSLYNTAKAELNNRLKNGESNIRIKSIGGVPTVVKINSETASHQNGNHQKNQERGRALSRVHPNQ